ncbi:MAG TPA: formate dehydrogenase accessory sulfurtransferase FdhD, partial [Stellaceae bacterium]|nr:formate dehydrogenase accessory sulfurtransferase FdhD [Stellaceae bacterium]
MQSAGAALAPRREGQGGGIEVRAGADRQNGPRACPVQSMIPPASLRLSQQQFRAGLCSAGRRSIAEEVPVAFTYRGCSYAVMMATPLDLEDFAVGFSLTEGLATNRDEIEAVTVRPRDEGLVL